MSNENSRQMLIEALQKAEAGNHRYTKRIPNPNGKGYIYFYTREQINKYKENGEKPEQEKEEKKIEMTDEGREQRKAELKQALKKMANIMADVFSKRDPVPETASAVEQAGDNLARNGQNKKNEKKQEKSEHKP